MPTDRHSRLDVLSSLPSPVLFTLALLTLGVPAAAYQGAQLQAWQTISWPSLALLAPFSDSVRIGRCIGAFALAAALVRWRTPASVATAVTAVWLGGPPLDLLLHGLRTLALSSGRVSWRPQDVVLWLPPASLVPTIVTLALLVPQSVRRTYGLSRSTLR